MPIIAWIALAFVFGPAATHISDAAGRRVARWIDPQRTTQQPDNQTVHPFNPIRPRPVDIDGTRIPEPPRGPRAA